MHGLIEMGRSATKRKEKKGNEKIAYEGTPTFDVGHKRIRRLKEA